MLNNIKSVKNSKVMNTAPTEVKTIKTNPSQSYIGFSFLTKDTKTVNYRQGKLNTVDCSGAKCTGANATGRRLNVEFYDTAGKIILERRIYKEYFEKMVSAFGVLLPE